MTNDDSDEEYKVKMKKSSHPDTVIPSVSKEFLANEISRTANEETQDRDDCSDRLPGQCYQCLRIRVIRN